jgi:predicted TIM-barrel fold metal-dependent hydrolase
MYSGQIIDPHHHLWDLSMGKHPWLSPSDPTVQAIDGLAEIAHDCLVDDYVRDSSGQNVVASVHIEALWAGDPVGETRWLETLDKSKGVALRYVAGASLGKPGADAIIAEQASFDRVTGVRGILSWHPDPKKCFVTDPELGRNPRWRRDVALLEKHGLSLELMMYPYQAQIVREIAESQPGLQIIINHCGSPIDRDPEGMQRWRDGLKLISACPNLAIKISNPGAYDPPWTLESVRPVAMHCIDCFGVDRSMFGTDYPVSKIHMNFNQIYGIFKTIASVLTPEEQAKLFHHNAKRYYRL